MEWNTTTISVADLLGSNTTLSAPSNHTGQRVELPLLTWVTEVCVSLPVACLGVVGNVVAFLVLCGYKQKQSTTVYLQALALSDTVCLMLTIFLHSLTGFGSYRTQQSYHHAYRWGYPLMYTVRLLNTWLTVLLTIDRCMAVRSPLLASRFGKTRKAYAWVAGIALASLAFSFVRFFEVEVDQDMIQVMRMPWIKNETYTILYRIVAFFLVMYLIPLAILIGANYQLLRTLSHADERRNELQTHLTASAAPVTHANAITKIVVAIVIMSICSSSCAGVTHVLWSLAFCYPALKHLDVPRFYLSPFNNLLIITNSAINVLVYCAWSRKFRSVASVCCHCRWRCNRFGRLSLGRQSQTSGGSTDTRQTNVNNTML